MAQAKSKLAAVWQTLRDANNKKIPEQLITEFQEWCQEEEFDYNALMDDIKDKEDESTIAQWLRDHNYNKHNEFMELQQVISPAPPSPPEEDMKYDEDSNDLKNATKKKEVHSVSSLALDIDPSNPNFDDLLITLNSHLNLDSNPSIVQKLISQLEQYSTQDPSAPATATATATATRSTVLPTGSTPKVSGDDLHSVRSALGRLNEYTTDELDEFVRFCNDEEYGEDQLIDDIEVFEEGDSAIIENIASIFHWNSGKGSRFVNSLRDILGVATINHNKMPYFTPQGSRTVGITISTPTASSAAAGITSYPPHAHAAGSDDYDASDLDSLPKLHDFIVPLAVVKRRRVRCLDDIEDCLKENGISSTIVELFSQFCIDQKCDEEDIIEFKEVTHGATLKQEYPEIGAQLSQYVEKCLYELQVPAFKPSTFTKQDESRFGEYIDGECPGILKHDRDLLRYFLLTRETEPDLSSLLIDIVDRISVHDEYPMDLSTFASKSFFKELSKAQASIIKNGLRTYHNRFFPRLTMNPLYLIGDKLSDFQKYACVLSAFVKEVMDRRIIAPPTLIDFMIVPPGVYSRVINNFNAEKCTALGDIKQHLDDFDNDSYSIVYGLSAENNNFDAQVVKQMVNELCNATQKVMQTVEKKQHQRIVVAVDRRWRILNNKHCIYNKLRCVHSHGMSAADIVNKEAYDYEEYKKDVGMTRGDGYERMETMMNGDDDDAYDDDDDDEDGNIGGSSLGFNKTEIKFETKQFITRNRKRGRDTIYVFQPKAQFKVRKLNEFSDKFCHETLMYLTKRCILPRKTARVQEYKGQIQEYHQWKEYKSTQNTWDDEDEFDHLSGSAPDGWMFNLAVHIYKPYPNDIWYKYKVKWYLFTQGASIRVHHNDFNNFWCKYFVDAEKDIHKMSDKELKKYFKFDLDEADVGFKRWYYSIKKTLA